MNRPPIKTMLLGHPLIGLPIYGVGAFILYQCWYDPSLWLFGVGALAAMSTAAKASDQADAYRNWKRAWDAMGDGPLPSGRGGRIARFLIGVAMIAALILFLLGHSDQPAYRLALGWLVVVGGGGLVALLVIWLFRLRPKRAAKAAKNSVVTVAIARPIFAVPDMLQSYRQLPEHCHLVMRARPHDGAN